MATARRRVTDQVVGGYLDQVEHWKASRDDAGDGLEFEELLSLANTVFDGISRWDAVWHQKAFAGEIPYSEEEERTLLSLYRLWLEPSDDLLGEIRRFEALGYHVVGAGPFRQNRREALALFQPEPSAAGDAMARLEDEAIREHRSGLTVAMTEIDDDPEPSHRPLP